MPALPESGALLPVTQDESPADPEAAGEVEGGTVIGDMPRKLRVILWSRPLDPNLVN